MNYTIKKDSTRLINPASGGNLRNCGNIFDVHHYPDPLQEASSNNSINVIGEYGGVALKILNHTWRNDSFGYIRLNTSEEVTLEYEKYIDKLINLTRNGTSAAIYTQTTDVEKEINGLITYDRNKMKIIENRIKTANLKLIKTLE